MKTLLKTSLAITVLLSVISCKQNQTSTAKDMLAVNSESTIKKAEIKSANVLNLHQMACYLLAILIQEL